MADTLEAIDVEVGYHPDGFRIDKTAGPMNLYTKWEITPEGKWVNPKPTCFHSLPEHGWRRADRFDWDDPAEDGGK